MLARLGSRARHSLDIDLSGSWPSLDDVEEAFNAATSTSMNDYFSFQLGPGAPVAQAERARRVPVVAYLGVVEFARFHVDLVVAHPLTGHPDVVSPLIPLELPGLSQARYRAYPVVDHVADKLCAMIKSHPCAAGGTASGGSTRYRDALDLILFAHTAFVEARLLRAAVEREARRRGLTLPGSLQAPQGPGWASGYARIARDVPLVEERDLVSALRTLQGFLNPVLERTAYGHWDPQQQAWVRR